MTFPRMLAHSFTLLAFSCAASASPFSAVVAYGDSLSDNGNFFGFTGMPGAPYFEGRASNGLVAVEYLAAALGDPLRNFAWLGATTGIGNHLDTGGTPTSVGALGLPGMTASYLGSVPLITPIASTALFVVWGGPNDFLSPSPLDANSFAVADRAVSNISGIAGRLRALGAQHVFVPGMPDLGLTPSYLAMGPGAAMQASLLSAYFNTRLASSLPAGVRYFDTAGLLHAVVANPAAYGLSNVTEACFDEASRSVCSAPDEYLFWDSFHPTTRGHEIFAGQFVAAIPEPSTWLLSLSACALFLIRRR